MQIQKRCYNSICNHWTRVKNNRLNMDLLNERISSKSVRYLQRMIWRAWWILNDITIISHVCSALLLEDYLSRHSILGPKSNRWGQVEWFRLFTNNHMQFHMAKLKWHIRYDRCLAVWALLVNAEYIWYLSIIARVPVMTAYKRAG